MKEGFVTALMDFTRERLQPRARVRWLESSSHRQLALLLAVWGILWSQCICFVLMINDLPMGSPLSAPFLVFGLVLFLRIGFLLFGTAYIYTSLGWHCGRFLRGQATFEQARAATVGFLLPLPWIGFAWLVLHVADTQKVHLPNLALPISVVAALFALSTTIFMLRASSLGIAEVHRFGLVRGLFISLLTIFLSGIAIATFLLPIMKEG